MMLVMIVDDVGDDVASTATPSLVIVTVVGHRLHRRVLSIVVIADRRHHQPSRSHPNHRITSRPVVILIIASPAVL